MFWFGFFSLLLLQPPAKGETIWYSNNRLFPGTIGSREIISLYCESLPLFHRLQCSNSIPLLHFSGINIGEGINRSQTVTGPFGDLLWSSWDAYRNGTLPATSLREAKVVTEDIWLGVEGGPNCGDWSGGTCDDAKDFTIIKNPDVFEQDIPAACEGSRAIVCICLDGKFITPSPTGSPTTSPTTSPTNSPITSSPSTTPTTSGPSTTPTTSGPSITPTTSGPSLTPTTSRPSLTPTFAPTTSAPSFAPTTSAPTFSPTRVWTQLTKLVGTGGVGNSVQGYSVSMSGDGNTVAIGAYEDNTYKGATWIFKYTTSWNQVTKLVGTGGVGTNNRQGTSVSLSADGSTLAVGAIQDDSNKGATWIFKYTTSWNQVTKLVGTGGLGSSFYQGRSVSLSADGNTLAVGGSLDDNGKGATWIFKFTTSWNQMTKLVGTGVVGSYAYQGFSVSLSADGTTLAVGGMRDDTYKGATWIFKYTTSWNQVTKLVGTGGLGTSNHQGNSVSLSADGNTLAAGGPSDDNYKGATWIFRYNTTHWQQVTKIVGTDGLGTYYHQGNSVSLSADGNTVAVGGIKDDGGKGATWIFRYTTVWQQVTKIVGTGGLGLSEQGSSVSMSGDGNKLAVGASNDDGNKGATFLW